MQRREIKIRCFAVPLTFIIAIPLVATPTAFVAWNLRNSTNSTVPVEKPTVWFDVQVISGSHDGRSTDGEGIRPEASAAKPRTHSRSVSVGQNASDPSDPILSGPMHESDAKNGTVLLRPVPGSVRGSKEVAGEEGSGDGAEGGIVRVAGPAGEAAPPDTRHH